MGDRHRTGLKSFEQTLNGMGRYTETHTAGGVTFAEGRDPGGLRVIDAHPDPSEKPLLVFETCTPEPSKDAWAVPSPAAPEG